MRDEQEGVPMGEAEAFHGTGLQYLRPKRQPHQQSRRGRHTWTYEWNAENQLKQVLKNGVEQASFKYDPIGRRVRFEGSLVSDYLYDDIDILRRTGGVSQTTYVPGERIDEPLAQETGVCRAAMEN